MQPRILVPYDFSYAAECALRWAAELKRSVGGGSIKLLYVLSSRQTGGAIGALPWSVPCEETLEEAEAALSRIAAQLAPEASVAAVLGIEVGSRVMEEADAHGAELIVMGTHGRGGVKRMMLGSVADYVIRHARCPVVSVKPPASASETK